MKRKRFVAIFLALCIFAIGAISYVLLLNLKKEDIRRSALTSPPVYLRTLDMETTQQEGLQKPLDVARFGGATFVLDGESSSIKVFDGNDNFIRDIKIESDDEHVKPYPVSLAIDVDSQVIYVAESHSSRLRKYGLNGEHKGFLPQKDGVIKKPVSLAYKNHLIYVADADDQTIKAFDVRDKSMIMEFGGRGSEPGQFLFPTGIAINDRGDIYVVDSNNKRIEVFDSRGTFKEVIRKSRSDYFALPRDITIDGQGLIHAVDAFNHRVCVFNAKGNFYFCYGSGNAAGALELPNGICIDDKKFEIYIADQARQQVIVYGYEES